MRNFKLKPKIYHGTISNIDEIDLSAGRDYKDFGKGFYLAYNKEQSIGIMNKKFKITKSRGDGKVQRTLYAFDTDMVAFHNCSTKVFDSADLEWLDFILKCRKSRGTPHNFDVVVGPTADDDTSMCLNMYWEGVYGDVGSISAKRTLLKNLEVEKLGTQVFIGTKKGLSILANKREGSY